MNTRNATLVILAAGMGSRYGGLKQLDAVGPNGEAILDYSIFDAIRAGFTKVVFIIRHDFEKIFKDQIVYKYKDKIDIELAFQDINDLPSGFSVPEGREKPWGTAHALLCTKKVVHEPFAIINADDFYGRTSFKVLHDYLVSDEPRNNVNMQKYNFAMVGFVLNNTLSEHGSVARGVCMVNEDGCLDSVEEHLKIYKCENGAEDRRENGEVKKLTGNELVSMNMWAFTPEIFPIIEQNFEIWLNDNVNIPKSEFLIPTEIDKLIRSDKINVKVLKTDSKWFGVTYKDDKPIVVKSIKALFDQGIY